MMGSHEDQNVCMYVQMDCTERDGPIAAEFFTVFQKLLGARFPRAMITGRQYDKNKHPVEPLDSSG